MRPGGIDAVEDALATKHILADRLAADNASVTAVKKLKYPKGTPEGVKKLTRFYRFERAKIRPARQYADMDMAYELYIDNSPSSLRWVVEALLMGGDAVADVAEDLGLPEKVIELYESNYFHISDALLLSRLRAVVVTRNTSLSEGEVDRWTHKLECLALGLDAYKRVHRIAGRSPTKDDLDALRMLSEQELGKSRNKAIALAANPNSYKQHHLVEMLNSLGATYKHVQTDNSNAAKMLSTKASSQKDDTRHRLEQIFLAQNLRLEDCKISFQGEDLPAEEPLPIPK